VDVRRGFRERTTPAAPSIRASSLFGEDPEGGNTPTTMSLSFDS
jgi:hypothetical protein